MISRVAANKAVLLAFIGGQGFVQAINFAIALMLLRWMTIDQFALYSLSLAVLGTVAALSDGGLNNSVIALTGSRHDQPDVIGQYIAAARLLRNITLPVALTASFAVFAWLANSHAWSPSLVIGVFAGVAASAWMQSFWVYATPLLLRKDMTSYYHIQLCMGGIRGILLILLHISGYLSAISAIWVGALSAGVAAFLLLRQAQVLIRDPIRVPRDIIREVLRYLAPVTPAVIFAAFQPHIAVAIISMFGSTHAIAEVAALGRLSQLFMLLSAFNSLVVAPHVAKLPGTEVWRRYYELLAAAIGCAAALTATCFRFPSSLCWILGPKYTHLEMQVGWVMLYTCISFVSQTMWTVHISRQWIWKWTSVTLIPWVVGVQILVATAVDLSTVKGVIMFNLATNIAILAVHLATAIYARLASLTRSMHATVNG